MPKTCKQFCQSYKKKTLKLNSELIKTLPPKLNKAFQAKNKNRNTDFKKIQRECNLYYCNKTCKNTLFEAGRNKYPPLSKAITSNKKLKTIFTKGQKQNKKEIFGDKDNVLKDGFYEKLSPQKVKRLKQNGATSGCVGMVFTNSPAL